MNKNANTNKFCLYKEAIYLITYNILNCSAFELLSVLLFKDQNTTLHWFAIQKEVNTSLTEKLIDVQQQITKLDQKVNRMTAEFSYHGKATLWKDGERVSGAGAGGGTP